MLVVVGENNPFLVSGASLRFARLCSMTSKLTYFLAEPSDRLFTPYTRDNKVAEIVCVPTVGRGAGGLLLLKGSNSICGDIHVLDGDPVARSCVRVCVCIGNSV